MVSRNLHCKLLVALIVIHLVSSLPLNDPVKRNSTAVNKRNNRVNEARQTLRQLEQIERYYQQLFIRGLLNDDEYVNLERLQNVIEQLRHILNTTGHPMLT